MLPARRIAQLIPLVMGALVLALPASASAQDSPLDPLGFHYSSPIYTVDESAGVATITIERTNTSGQAWIRYNAQPGTAVKDQDFTPEKNILSFAPGQSSASFQIPIVDHGLPEPPKTILLGMFGAYPIGVASPSSAVLTIVGDDQPSIVRDPLNPLGLASTPPASDPLTGAKPFIDWEWGLASLAEDQLQAEGKTAQAAQMNVIAQQPEVHRWGNWTPTDEVATQVSQFMVRAAYQEPGTIPEFSTYWLQNDKCGGADPPSRAAQWHQWISDLAQGVGDYPAIMFLEEDSVITMGCLSPHGRAVRIAELHDAINILSKLPRLVVYVDAGAADALSARRTARLLNHLGVSQIQGFFLNSTHFDWTLNEIHYGEQISKMTGGKHFVVNTAENGRGPLVPHNRARNGNEVLCNPPGRGLGPKPTFDTGYRNVDAFAWIARPGVSGGACRPGAPKTGIFWPAYALSLVKNADFSIR